MIRSPSAIGCRRIAVSLTAPILFLVVLSSLGGCMDVEPTVQITSHQAGQRYCDEIGTIRAEASDDTLVEEVIFFINDQEGFRQNRPLSVVWDCDQVVDLDSYSTIRVQAIDNANNSDSDDVSVFIVDTSQPDHQSCQPPPQ